MPKNGEILPVGNQNGLEVTDGDLKILRFEDVGALMETLEDEGWTADEEIRTLVQLARESANEGIRLRAIKLLQTRRAEVLKAAGLLVQASRSRQEEDGSRTTLSANVVAAALGKFRDRKQEQEKVADGQENENKESQAEEGAGTSRDPIAVHRRPTKSITLPGLATGGPADGDS
jgi:hypothetical protein